MAARELTDLSGVEVALTGRFASMTQAEIAQLVTAAGGINSAMPGAGTQLLVIGRGGMPLSVDGRLTASLTLARRLQATGSTIEIVGEEQLLARLACQQPDVDLGRLYTTAQIARILGVPASRIRAWTRSGLIEPAQMVGRIRWFEFAQVASARTLVQLAARGVTAARLRHSLRLLDGWLDTGGSALSQLESLEGDGGGPLLVRLDDGRLAEPSGQLRLGFESRSIPSPTTQLPGPPLATPAMTEAAQLFERGVLAEERAEYSAAAATYERCLEIGGPDAETSFNLGNTLYALGRHTEAARRYSQATSLEPDFAEAWNNLGNVLTEIDRGDEGVVAYRRALSLSPTYADVHFNLAETLAAQGQRDAARHHWRAYLAADPHGESAQRVRERLAELD